MAEARKLIDLMQENADKPWISLEYFPPRTDAGVTNLYERIERMKQLDPLFVDFTWGAGGSTADLTLELTANSKKKFGLEANMHLTCTNQTSTLTDEALDKCKAEPLPSRLPTCPMLRQSHLDGLVLLSMGLKSLSNSLSTDFA